VNSKEANIFAPITKFGTRNINGERRNHLVVGNNEDPRTGGFDFESTVSKNWPSQRSWQFPKGYLELANGKRLSLQDHTIDGVKKYLFPFRIVGNLFEMDINKRRIIELLNVLNDRDYFAAVELIEEEALASPRLSGLRAWLEQMVPVHLHALGRTQLSRLRDLLELDNGCQKSSSAPIHQTLAA